VTLGVDGDDAGRIQNINTNQRGESLTQSKPNLKKKYLLQKRFHNKMKHRNRKLAEIIEAKSVTGSEQKKGELAGGLGMGLNKNSEIQIP